jgi:thiamine-monophosphate kinase
MISITVIGYADEKKIVKRSGAKPGDLLVASGDLGGAYMGLQMLEREKQVFLDQKDMQPDLEGQEYIVGRQLRPEARTDIIELLDEIGIIPTAMIDISDGLSSEIFHLCNHSKIGMRVYEDKLPIDQQTYDTALEFNLAPTTCAMNGGEDYELLFTLPQSDYDKVKNSIELTVIGYCTEPHLGLEMITKSGNVVVLEAQGWENFKG